MKSKLAVIIGLLVSAACANAVLIQGINAVPTPQYEEGAGLRVFFSGGRDEGQDTTDAFLHRDPALYEGRLLVRAWSDGGGIGIISAWGWDEKLTVQTTFDLLTGQITGALSFYSEGVPFEPSGQTDAFGGVAFEMEYDPTTQSGFATWTETPVPQTPVPDAGSTIVCMLMGAVGLVGFGRRFSKT